MINPVQPAVDFFITFWSCIPTVIQSFVFLAVGLFAVVSVIHLVMK